MGITTNICSITEGSKDIEEVQKELAMAKTNIEAQSKEIKTLQYVVGLVQQVVEKNIEGLKQVRQKLRDNHINIVSIMKMILDKLNDKDRIMKIS